MKKIMLLTMSLMLGSFILSGCSQSSDPFEEKTYTPDLQVRTLHIDVRDREIDVELSEDDQVHILYSENSKEYYDIAVSDDHVLTMMGNEDKDWTDYVGMKPSAKDRKIVLQIPNDLLKDLTLSTTNEDISLSGITITGNAYISSNGGNIYFESLDVKDSLTLDAKNGNISGSLTESYEDFSIRSAIKKGESNLPEHKDSGKKILDVSCNNGNIDIEFAAGAL